MTKITLLCEECEYSVSSEKNGVSATELVDMFGGLMLAATYTHGTVCSVLNTEMFHSEDNIEVDEDDDVDNTSTIALPTP